MEKAKWVYEMKKKTSHSDLSEDDNELELYNVSDSEKDTLWGQKGGPVRSTASSNVFV